jgi:integrase
MSDTTTPTRKAKDGLWQDEDGYWHIDVTVNGLRRKRATGTQVKPEATQLRDQIRSELWRIAHLGERPKVTWDQTVLAWLADAERRKLRSLPDYEDKFLWLSDRRRFGGKLMGEIDKQLIVTVLNEKYAGDPPKVQPVSGSTVNRYYAAISSVFVFAKDTKNWLTTIPKLSKDEKYPENDGRFRWLSRDEWGRMQAKPRGSITLQRMARFSLATGLRQSNVIWLEKKDVDLKRRTAWAWGYQTKNENTYSIPLNDDAMAVLEEAWGDHPKYVFVYTPPLRRDGSVWREPAPISNPLNDPWYHWLRGAEIHDFTWHGFRHTWASWHVMNGTPLEVLQKLGGWKKFDMVLKYGHLATSYVHTFANNARPV